MKCEEFKQKYNIKESCCTSCHEDDDMGFAEDLWFEIDGTDWNICCAMIRVYESRPPKKAN